MAKKDLWYLFLQIIPVMVGVYLGFWLSERGEQKHLDEKVNKLETLLISEIESNKDEVTKKLSYHETLIDSLRYIMSADTKDERYQRFNNYTLRGLQPPSLKDAAYHSAIQTGLVTNFELEEVALLNEINTEQESLEKYADAVLSALLANGTFGRAGFEEMIGGMLMNLNDITAYENRLLNYYNTALEEVN